MRAEAAKTGVILPAVSAEGLWPDNTVLPQYRPHDPDAVELHHKGPLPDGWEIFQRDGVVRTLARADAVSALKILGDTGTGPLFSGPGMRVLDQNGFIRNGKPFFRSTDFIPGTKRRRVLPLPAALAIYQTPSGDLHLVEHAASRGESNLSPAPEGAGQ